MKSIVSVFYFLAVCVSAVTVDQNLYAASLKENWKTLESAHFMIHYAEDDFAFAQRTAAMAEKIHQKLVPLMRWEPHKKTQVVLLDTTDGINGSATPLPQNTITVYLSTPVDGALLSHQSWIEALFLHEYTHILHLDQVAGLPQKLRDIFGKNSAGPLALFSLPQVFAPHWLSEGIAIYHESLSGFGRGNSAVYESRMRQEVIHGLRSYSEVSYEGYSGSRWPFGLVYLYGAYFYQFIRDTYGEEKIADYIANYSDNITPWRMDSRARETFGIGSVALWKAYQHYLMARFKPQIEQIKNGPAQSSAILVDEPFNNGLVSRGPNNTLIYYHNNAANKKEIRQLGQYGLWKTLLKLNHVSHLDWRKGQSLLVTKSGICDGDNFYSDVYRLHLKTHQLTRLSHCQRLSKAVFGINNETVYAIKKHSGRSALVQLKHGKVTTISSFPLGDSIGSISIAPDGSQIVASIRREKTGWNLEILNLEDRTWKQVTQSLQKEQAPRFSPDGRLIYYLADNEEKTQIELHRLNTDSNRIEQLTNSLGYVIGFSLSEQGVWLQEYSARNERIRYLEKISTMSSRINKPAQPDSFSRLMTLDDFDLQTYTNSRAYNAFNTLEAQYWAPILDDDEQLSQFGITFGGSDALGFHKWALTPFYYFHNEVQKPGGLVSYIFHEHFDLTLEKYITAGRNPGSETLQSYTESTHLETFLRYPVKKNNFTLDFGLGAAQITKEKTTIAQTAQSNMTATDSYGLTFHYNNLNRYRHGISFTDGVVANLVTEKYAYPSGLEGNASIIDAIGHFAIQGKQVLKISALYATSDLDISAFQLGGNPSVQSLLSKRKLGKRDFSLRGYAPSDALLSKRIMKTGVEYHFPIASIYDGGSIFPVGVGKVYGNVFVESGAVWKQQQKSKNLTGVGVEFSFNLLVGFDSLNIPVTIGVAKGLDRDLGEFQTYLQVRAEFY